jgi:hypothetical protein
MQLTASIVNSEGIRNNKTTELQPASILSGAASMPRKPIGGLFSILNCEKVEIRVRETR